MSPATDLLSPAADVIAAPAPPLDEPRRGEDLLRYIDRVAGRFDLGLYRRILGAANEWKEGDAAQGVAAPDDASRRHARTLLARTRIGDLDAHPVFEDDVSRYIASAVDPVAKQRIAGWTLGEWKEFLLTRSTDEIAAVLPGVPSDVAAFTVKLLGNDELIAVGAKIFNPLPGSKIGAKGYLGARIQPNSPTDDVEDIVWQVFDGWSYAVGDVVLGSNPVSSDVESVAAIERALGEVIATFGLERRHAALRAGPHRRAGRGRTPLPRLAPRSGSRASPAVDDANTTFDISVEKMLGARRHARRTLRPLLRDRPGRRLHQRPRPGLRHGDARGAQVRLRARAAARGRRGAAARRAARPRPGSTSTTSPASSAPRCSAPASSSSVAASRTS